MRLTHLRGTVAGRTFDQPISPVAVVVGPNDSGKSSLLGLVTRALNRPTRGDATDWDALAMMGDELTIRRRLHRTVHSLSLEMGTSYTQHITEGQRIIEAKLGAAGTFSAVSYLALSGDARNRFLQGGLLNMGWTYYEVAQLLGEIWTWVRGDALAHDVFLSPYGRRSPDEPCGRAMFLALRDSLREEYRRLNAEAQRLRALVEEGSRAPAVEPPPGTVAHWRSQLASLDEQLASARERRGVIAGETTARATLERLCSDLAKRAETLQRTDWPAVLAAAGERLEAARVADRAAQEALSGAQGSVLAAKRAADHAREAVRTANVVRTADGTRLRAIAEALVSDLGWLGDGGPPPSHVRDLLFRLRNELVDSAALVPDAANLEQEARAAATRQEAAQRAYDRLIAGAQKALGAVAAADGEVRRAQADSANHVERLDAIVAELEKAQEQLGALPNTDAAPLDQALHALGVERAGVVKTIDVLTDLAGREAAVEGHRAALHLVTDRRTLVGDMGKRVAALFASRMASALAPVTEPASRITRHVLGAELVIDPESDADVRLRWGDLEVGIAACSHSEAMVALMALQVGVQSQLPGWRHVILDDLEGLEPARRSRFFEAMLACGDLDNVLCAAVDDGWNPPDGVQLIRLEGTR